MNGVLGSDFLSTVPKIDFGLGVLEYQTQEISLQNQSLAYKASVRATEAFTIRAKTNVRFPAEVMNEVALMRLETELFLQVVLVTLVLWSYLSYLSSQTLLTWYLWS